MPPLLPKEIKAPHPHPGLNLEELGPVGWDSGLLLRAVFLVCFPVVTWGGRRWGSGTPGSPSPATPPPYGSGRPGRSWAGFSGHGCWEVQISECEESPRGREHPGLPAEQPRRRLPGFLQPEPGERRLGGLSPRSWDTLELGGPLWDAPTHAFPEAESLSLTAQALPHPTPPPDLPPAPSHRPARLPSPSLLTDLLPEPPPSSITPTLPSPCPRPPAPSLPSPVS